MIRRESPRPGNLARVIAPSIADHIFVPGPKDKWSSCLCGDIYPGLTERGARIGWAEHVGQMAIEACKLARQFLDERKASG